MKMKRPELDRATIGWVLGAGVALGLVGAGAVVGLGLYNVSAQRGHYPGISPILHATFRNSVALHAPPETEVPDLTADMATLGARHYDAACRTCHSAPGRQGTATMNAMVPRPPHIERAVGHWSAAEFQWIVHEGVKMSGMPAWPAHRPDEVWPVVAFLMDVQDGMDGATYDALVALDDGAEGIAYCASCHGENGATDNTHIPRLDIQSEDYLAMALEAYHTSTRDSGVMEHAASEVPTETLPTLAARFADMGVGAASDVAPETSAAGRELANAERGTRVPSCSACHGPWPEPLDASFPSLAGQNRAYLVAQLKLWREGTRGGSDVAELMAQSAQFLTDDDIAALADYYAAMPPARLDEMTGD